MGKIKFSSVDGSEREAIHTPGYKTREQDFVSVTLLYTDRPEE